MDGISGGCACGTVRFRAAGSPFWSVLCHCADCRTATGAASTGWLGFAKASVAWTGTRSFLRTSPGATRGACPDCGAALSYMSTRHPGELYLCAAALDDPGAFRPEAHVHWSERVPDAGGQDDLPRHSGRAPAVLTSLRPAPPGRADPSG